MKKYYRQLLPHEILQVGDVSWCDHDRVIDLDYGIGIPVSERATSVIGNRADFCSNAQWRELVTPPDEWISCEDRMPTNADYIDEKILAQMQDGETCLYYQQFEGDVEFDDSDGIVAFWKRLTPATPKEKPITVNVGDKDEAVKFMDGYMMIGCQRVKASPETLRKIADRIDGKS